MASFARVTLAGTGTPYGVNLSEVVLITRAAAGTQIVFTGPNSYFANLHDNPGGDAGITVSEPIETVLAGADKGTFARVTPIETASEHIYEGPETYINLSKVLSIYKDGASAKTWVVLDSVIYVDEASHLGEGIRPAVLGVRETLDEILAR